MEIEIFDKWQVKRIPLRAWENREKVGLVGGGGGWVCLGGF